MDPNFNLYSPVNSPIPRVLCVSAAVLFMAFSGTPVMAQGQATVPPVGVDREEYPEVPRNHWSEASFKLLAEIGLLQPLPWLRRPSRVECAMKIALLLDNIQYAQQPFEFPPLSPTNADLYTQDKQGKWVPRYSTADLKTMLLKLCVEFAPELDRLGRQYGLGRGGWKAHETIDPATLRQHAIDRFFVEPLPPGTVGRIPLPLQLGAGASVDAITFSPDSHIIVTASTTKVKGSVPPSWVGRVQLWDTRTIQLLRELGRAAASPDTPQQLPTDPLLGGFSGPLQVAFSPDGKMIATSTSVVSLWDASTGKLLRTLHWAQVGNSIIYEEFVTSLTFSADSKEVIVGLTSHDNKVRLFDVQTGKQNIMLPVAKHPGGGASAVPIVLSPDGKILATGGESVNLWFIGNRW